MRHLLTLFDLTTPELAHIFDLAEDLKTRLTEGTREQLFHGHVIGLLFEKPSLRTRVSFEAAVAHLGGSSIYLGKDVGWGQRESTADFSRVVSQYLDVLVCRSKQHAVQLEMARHSTCPVVNGLSDLAHPCQALADLFTLRELCGSMEGKTLTFVGDGNNVARSLALACAHLSVRFVLAAPAQHQLDSAYVDQVLATFPQAQITMVEDPAEAVAGACAVYTDVWASMGQESERQERRRVFAPYQVNAQLMAKAPEDAFFLHCLPARRGEEVTDEVIDSPHSVVVQQAANRMHLQKGVLAWLFEMRRTE
jgi:ornithine carbamoyltransferase